MKIEKEPLSGHSAFLSSRDSLQFRFMKNNTATPLASEINEKDVLLNTPELERVVIVEDLTDGTKNKIIDTPGFCKIPSHKINRSGKTDVHTERTIRPSVCYQDNSYAVKDISVDEKVVVKDKLMDNNDKNGCIGDKGSVVTKESDSDEFLSPDGSLQSSENDDSNDSQELKSSSESTLISTGAVDETDSNPTTKRTADVSPGEAFNVIPLSQDFSSQKTLKSFLLSSDKDKNESDEPTTKLQIPCSEVTYGIPVGGLACNNKLDCVTNASEFKYYKLDNGSDEAQQGQGESSLSMAGTSSGRITYSGPMLVYSGSVSIRSDSSSTRSFAFPILQPEWHTSPIKMAKPDRRQYRKQGGWKQSLICCRF